MNCPKCEKKGRSIDPVTVQAQVVEEHQIDDFDGWRMCTSEHCNVIYFRDGDVVMMGDTRAVPFHKGTDPDRLVCFCFQHAVADLQADPTIRDAIAAACKAGEDDCPRKNPQGRCCLGNVGAVLKTPTNCC